VREEAMNIQTSKAVSRAKNDLRKRLKSHGALLAGLTREIEQGIDAGFNDETIEAAFMCYLLRIEHDFRIAAYILTGKAELLSADQQSFDGNTLSRIGEADIHV